MIEQRQRLGLISELSAVRAKVKTLRKALQDLVDQVDRSEAVDPHGHELKHLKALADAKTALRGCV